MKNVKFNAIPADQYQPDAFEESGEEMFYKLLRSYGFDSTLFIGCNAQAFEQADNDNPTPVPMQVIGNKEALITAIIDFLLSDPKAAVHVAAAITEQAYQVFSRIKPITELFKHLKEEGGD